MSLHKTGSQIIPADATSVADLEILDWRLKLWVVR
jgi:hypothetical protein